MYSFIQMKLYFENINYIYYKYIIKQNIKEPNRGLEVEDEDLYHPQEMGKRY